MTSLQTKNIILYLRTTALEFTGEIQNSECVTVPAIWSQQPNNV